MCLEGPTNIDFLYKIMRDISPLQFFHDFNLETASKDPFLKQGLHSFFLN
jgi:hypothetical protein